MTHRSSLPLGRVVAWPLVVGAAVLAIGWAAWEMASGHAAVDAVSTAASALAAFAVGVLAIALAIDLIAGAYSRFIGEHPRFFALDWMVPIAALTGFVLGLLAWK